MLWENTLVKIAGVARKKLEAAYTGVCEVREHVYATDAKTGLTRPQGAEKVVYEALPCRLSCERVSAAQGTELGAAIAQGVKLFCAPDVVIKPGSKITVTQNGVTTEYTASGPPAVYPTHQEVLLELFKGWA